MAELLRGSQNPGRTRLAGTQSLSSFLLCLEFLPFVDLCSDCLVSSKVPFRLLQSSFVHFLK